IAVLFCITGAAYPGGQIVFVIGGATPSFWLIVDGGTGTAATRVRVLAAAMHLAAHRGDQVPAVLGGPLPGRLPGAERVEGGGRHGEVGRGQLLELAVHGEHQGAVGAVGRELGAGGRRVEHHGEALPTPGRYVDDVAAAQRGEDAPSLGPLRGRAAA